MLELLTHLSVLLVIVATAAMSASASIQAVRHEFDAFGATVLAVASSVGGGTVRDILLGNTPVFWMTDLTFLSVSIPVGLVTFILAQKLKVGGGSRLRMLMYFDAIGLALFTLAGIQAANAAGSSAPIALIMGCITGTFGGLIRDLLCNVTPSVLKEDLYAVISLVGGVFFLAMDAVIPIDFVALWLSFAVILIARLFVIARSFN